MADRTGLEPATSGVTGRHSNQLNYRSALNLLKHRFAHFEKPAPAASLNVWWVVQGSNL